MRVLFAVTHIGFLRNFESTLALLGARGHQVHIVSDRGQVPDVIDTAPIIDRLKARYPGAFTTEVAGLSKRSGWYLFSLAVRAGLDYWRYLAPEFDQAPKLRARGRENAPRLVRWLTSVPGLRPPEGVARLQRVFRALEGAIPPRRSVERLFAARPWDLVFVTPLLYFGSQQVDYIRAARRRGIPTVLGVGSWDHLTTKGLIHEQPDRVVVWNEGQQREAVELHGVDPGAVVVTGAQAYDHWFAMGPSTTRERFCAQAGLPADRPYLLYLCSSPFITPHEVEFVKRWARAVRASASPALRRAGLLVRPHPQNARQWATADLSEIGDVSVWPRAGANPLELEARRQYFDSMYHSHAVVGINTSALIESGIVGRPVYSLRADEFADTQEGTLHFQHLKRGGLLRLSDSLDAHVADLERSFESIDEDRARIRSFIGSFVRPQGLDRPATPLVVDAIEDAGRLVVGPRPLPAATRRLQMVLGVLMLRPGQLVARVRTDRAYWWSVMRHVLRPPRIAARRLRWGLAVVRAWARRHAAALPRRVRGIVGRTLAVPRRIAARVIARGRALV
jgi:hypothetical protein